VRYSNQCKEAVLRKLLPPHNRPPHCGEQQLVRAAGNRDGDRGCEYDRGTGCCKSAGPGLGRGLRVTGITTPD